MTLTVSITKQYAVQILRWSGASASAFGKISQWPLLADLSQVHCLIPAIRWLRQLSENRPDRTVPFAAGRALEKRMFRNDKGQVRADSEASRPSPGPICSVLGFRIYFAISTRPSDHTCRTLGDREYGWALKSSRTFFRANC